MRRRWIAGLLAAAVVAVVVVVAGPDDTDRTDRILQVYAQQLGISLSEAQQQRDEAVQIAEIYCAVEASNVVEFMAGTTSSVEDAIAYAEAACPAKAEQFREVVEPGEGERSPLELTTGDACADAYFWAATDSGDVAVTVSIEARDRSPVEATTLEFTVPDATVAVEVLEGESLARNLCNDLILTQFEPQDRQEAVAGEGTITLDPMPEGPNSLDCGSVSGELELTGLEAEDGTTFAPIRVTSDSIGCYAG